MTMPIVGRVLPLTLATLTCLGCSTYSVRRSALVPNIAPPARSGQPAGGRVELALSTPRAMSFGEPREGEGANAGLYLPRTEVVGELRVPARGLSPDLDIGILYDQGFLTGATAISPDQPKPRNGSAIGFGPSIYFAPEVSPGFRLGFGLSGLLYSVPFIEYRTCVSNCGASLWEDIEDGRKTVSVFSASLAPSFRTGALTVFGSLTARDHPTNTKGEVTNDPIFDSDDEIRSGPTNFITGVGVEYDFGRIKGLAQVFLPIVRDPVEYRPTLGVGIAMPLGQPPVYAQRPAPAPGPYGPPPGPYAPAPGPYAPAPGPYAPAPGPYAPAPPPTAPGPY